MIAVTVLCGLIAAFMGGVCLGAGAVKDVAGEPRLPAGWWVLPGAVMGGLFLAAFIIWVF